MNTLMGVVNKLFLEACYKTTNTVKLKFWVSCTIIRFKVTSIRALSIQSEMNYFTICESYGKKKNVKTVEHWTVLVKGTHYFFHVQDLLYSRFFYWWHEHILLNHNNCFIWCFFMPVQACVTENYKWPRKITC